MTNLFNFGLPTPGEVRQQANRRLFNTLSQYGGGALGQANMGAAALGMSLGRLFGGPGADEQRAQKIQSIQTQFGELQNASGIGAPKTPEEVNAWGRGLAGEMIKAGEGDMANKILRALPQTVGSTNVSEKTQDAVRKYIFSNRDALESKASLIVESMSGIDKLAEAATGGNRSARGALLQRVAKLAQGAGVVTDRDASAVAGDMNATAALLAAVLPNVDVDMKALMRSADPVGEGFNTENLLNVANALVASGKGAINNRMSDLKDQATEAEFLPQGTKAMFAGTRNINSLNKLGKSSPVKSDTLTNAEQKELQALRQKYGR